jgi:hypothetical protein
MDAGQTCRDRQTAVLCRSPGSGLPFAFFTATMKYSVLIEGDPAHLLVELQPTGRWSWSCRTTSGLVGWSTVFLESAEQARSDALATMHRRKLLPIIQGEPWWRRGFGKDEPIRKVQLPRIRALFYAAHAGHPQKRATGL